MEIVGVTSTSAVDDATVVGAIGVIVGLRLLWRGLRNDIPRTFFGEARIPRWCFWVGGFCLVASGGALVAFLLLCRSR